MQLEIACLFRPLKLTVGFAVWIPKVEDGVRGILLSLHVVYSLFPHPQQNP